MAFESDIQSALQHVPAFAGVLVRVTGMFLFAPLFGSGRIPRRVRAMVALCLAAAVTPSVTPVAFPGTIWELSVAVAGELMFGLAMGMVMSLVFVGAQWAGEILGQQLGFGLGAVVDPQFGASGTVVSDLLFWLTLVIFLCLNGHHAMMMGLRNSFDALPLFTAGIGPGGLDLVVGLLMSCTMLAMKLIAPVIVSMLVSDVVLGFVSKTMPQLNIMSAGMSLRALMGMFVIAAGLTLTSETLQSAILDSMDRVQRAWVTSWAAEPAVPAQGSTWGGN